MRCLPPTRFVFKCISPGCVELHLHISHPLSWSAPHFYGWLHNRRRYFYVMIPLKSSELLNFTGFLFETMISQEYVKHCLLAFMKRADGEAQFWNYWNDGCSNHQTCACESVHIVRRINNVNARSRSVTPQTIRIWAIKQLMFINNILIEELNQWN